jgi:hypothetical protein
MTTIAALGVATMTTSISRDSGGTNLQLHRRIRSLRVRRILLFHTHSKAQPRQDLPPLEEPECRFGIVLDPLSPHGAVGRRQQDADDSGTRTAQCSLRSSLCQQLTPERQRSR